MAQASRPASAFLLVAFFALLTLAVVVGFFVPWRSAVASMEGRGIDSVITYLLVSVGVLVVIGHAVLVWFLWRGSAAGAMQKKYRKPSTRHELLWSLIPVLVMMLVSEAGVLVVASPTWKALYIDEPSDPLVVEVVGKQFEWLVRYPGRDGVFGKTDLGLVDPQEGNPLGVDEDDDQALDDVVKVGTLYLPKDRPVVIRLHTQDVIHSFFVPHFRVKQDLIPGFPTRVKFTPTRTGDYELACSELCGLGHYRMRGTVHVLEPDEFEAWLAKQATFGG